MKTHYLKTVQPFFSEVKKGAKTFEHRRNDRNFQVGDEVYLQEYDLMHDSFSGQEVRGTITYVLTDRVGLDKDFCVFSIKVTQHLTKNAKSEQSVSGSLLTCMDCGKSNDTVKDRGAFNGIQCYECKKFQDIEDDECR